MFKVLENVLLKKTASLFSFACTTIVVSALVLWGCNVIRIGLEKEEQARIAELERQAEQFRELVCLTNAVHHEARGERPGVRKLVGAVILAMARDRFFSDAKGVCELARIRGMFSHIKYVHEIRSGESLWPQIYHEMSEVIERDLTLPPGWQCVRGFRVSDDKLETLSSKALKQLGFTMQATGLKYFAKSMVPIDTRGSITFYSPRDGCKLPTPTVQATL
jgi:hypothetical protein